MSLIKHQPLINKPYLIKQFGGFTLVEILITIVISAVLLGIAVPQLTDQVQKSHISSHVSDLMAAMNLARSEAVKSGRGVTMCRSTDQAYLS